MIRIGLSGTNWTGKSTTVEAVRASLPSLRIASVFLSDFIKQCPYPTYRDQTHEASRWMLTQVRAALDQAADCDVQFFDRTPIDILAFTRYAYLIAEESIDEELMTSIKGLLSTFDRIYLLSPSRKWPVGPRQEQPDVAFALLMDYHMNGVIQDLAIDVHRLPWDMDQRVRALGGALSG